MAFLLSLGFLVVAILLNEFVKPKPKIENARPAGIGDFRFPTATQGRPVPLIWGTVMLEGPNVVWYDDLEQAAIKEKIKTGMFSSKRVVVGFKYYLGVQFGLCRGEIDNIRRVLIGEKEVFSGAQGEGLIQIDEPTLWGGDDLGRGGVVGDLRVHVGSKTQAANTYLTGFQAFGGVTPTYKGSCYCVFEHGYLGNSTSVDPWKFEVRRIPNGLGLGTPGVNSGNDANPMNVIYEAMTNNEWGLGFPAADIDTSNFTTAATTLASEGNGFSFVLDRAIDTETLIKEVERQIDGLVYLDHRSGKWKVKLVRDDYNVDTIPQLNEDTLISVDDYGRGGWEDTTNEVRVEFNNRVNEYKEDYALAQDMANAMIQGGGTPKTGVVVSVTENYPGVKDGALGNQIAWRDLRMLSYPLAKATLVVDRSFWELTPGSVVAWTDGDLGFVKLPMRIQKIDYGSLNDAEMRLYCVQDVFRFQAGQYEDPPGSNWEPPEDTLTAYPTNEQIAFEAPRSFVFKDPDFTSAQDKIWAAARNQSGEVSFKIMERHTVGVPSGSYSEAGEVYGFMLVGTLKNTLAAGTAVPTSSILMQANPDSLTELEDAFEDSPEIVDQGKNLLNLIRIDDEFMLVRNASISGSDVSLNNVYRGVLDGGQRKHNSGAKIYLFFVGGGMADITIPDGNTVDIKLLPRSLSDTLAIGSATAIQFTMDDRLIRPYPPGRCSLNSSVFPVSASLDYLAAGAPETTGIDLDFIRRAFLTAEGGDEITALTTDVATLYPDYITDYTYKTHVEVVNDPDGSPSTLFSELNITAATVDILRIKILRYTDGVVPSRMRFNITSQHTIDGSAYVSKRELRFDFNTSSAALSGKFNFGAKVKDGVSNVYTATVAGQYDFTLSSSFAVGDVEYRLNSGSWVQLIPATTTTGSILGVSISDTIEIRHRSTDTSALKQIDMSAAGAGQDGYGIFYT